MNEFYQQPVEEVVRELNSDLNGLKEGETKERLEKYGLNKLEEKKPISKLRIFLNQFKSIIVWILIAAFLISLFISQEPIEAGVILAIIVINAVVGFVQEYNADKSIQALKRMMTLKAIVVRDGKKNEIDSQFLVPGDIIELEEGTRIPADIRLVECFDLYTQEASLTGESTPVGKNSLEIKEKLGVAEQKNMAFSGTTVVRGKGKGIVVRTGMNSEIGKVAVMIQEIEQEETPLQVRLKHLGKWIGVMVVGICVVVFGALVLSGGDIGNALMFSLSLAVAAIPEGLPAVVTISLALGIKRMAKRHALIRRLPSVETLGAVQVICSDKTGTLTKNEMTVKELYVNNEFIEVKGIGYSAEGKFLKEGKEFDLREIEELLKAGVLCNDSCIAGKENIIGDPTEAALLVVGEKASLDKEKLQNEWKRMDEVPFSSERKLMSVVNEFKERKYVYSKGAAEVLLEKCDRIYEKGNIRKMDEADRKRILEVNNEMGEKALRVLGFGFKELKEKEVEEKLVFLGLQGMIDPPRKEAIESVKVCRKAGIRVIMITGDHLKTAIAVARELGLEGRGITGKELEEMNEKEMDEAILHTDIFARVNPLHKMKIINALEANNLVTAMTGDGVNDAPALKKADMGIAMGIKGTDVAKEASDMILTDDNFASIVEAVEEGRGVYDNIKKFVAYLLSCNIAEVMIIFIAIVLSFFTPFPLPLIPIQLLWLNIVTDGLPALALGLDKPEKGIMNKPPRPKKEKIMNKRMTSTVFITSIFITVAVLFLFGLFYEGDLGNTENVIKAQTIAFTALVVFEVIRLQNIRGEYKVGAFSNKWLILAIGSSIFLQLIVLYTPLNVFFNTVALGITEWAYIIGVGIVLYLVSWVVGKVR
ncbi:MAG: calcium-translocating P-type ATPase, SERCA-type [archaeon]